MSVSSYVFVVMFIYSVTVHASEVTRSSRKHTKKPTDQLPSDEDIAHLKDMRLRSESLNFTDSEISATPFTKWSQWSRCQDCFQLRIKQCVGVKCKDSKIYEERPCEKKRCKRKTRQKENFRIVQLKQGNRYDTKQGYSKVWSKWSEWMKCSDNCRTYRYRVCRKPGRCKKRRQTQSAYCYHLNTTCEHFVLNVLDSSSRRGESEGIKDDERSKVVVKNTRINPTAAIQFECQQYEPQGLKAFIKMVCSLSTNNTLMDLSLNNRYHYNNYNEENPRRIRWKPKKCGRPYKKTSMLKIIGGIESKKYKWPWHVAVINMYREVFCAGTLIAPRWVLTAGHCIRSYLKVRLNEHNLRAIDGREIEMVVYKKYLHPKFNHQTVDNDIAMLKLPRAVKMPVACLPSRPPVPEEMCSIMGWGKVRSSDFYGTDVLHEASIPVVNNETCKKSYRQFFLTSNMFCAGLSNGAADTCAGDSGGGLMCRTNTRRRNSPYTIQGITSFGDGCGRRNKYGIYTMVYNYRTWIRYNVEHYS